MNVLISIECRCEIQSAVLSSSSWSLFLRHLLMPGVNAVPTPDTVNMHQKRNIQIWSGPLSLSQTFPTPLSPHENFFKIFVILASCPSRVKFDWQPLTLAKLRLTFGRLCRDTGGQSRLSRSASGWGHDTMEPADLLEVIIWVSSPETEAKGGHAVPAWSQSAQLVLKGGKKKKKNLWEKTRALVSHLTGL